MTEYTTKSTTAYCGATGFIGNHVKDYTSNEELKHLLLSEFKTNGIKGASIRFNRCGYLTSFTVTVRVKKSDLTKEGIRYVEEVMNTLSWQYATRNKYFSQELREKMDLVETIVKSYNYDKGNSMYDYYDRGFYDHYSVKVID